jgi:hypothetical protein
MTTISKLYGRVAEAASAFEARWTLRALRRTDSALYGKFVEQEKLWEAALVTGSDADVEEQTAAMCRGWQAVAARMLEAGAAEDACLMGQAPNGLRVAISDQRAAEARCDEGVVFVTPDEVATLVAAQRELMSIKQAFPGCEIVDLYPREPRPAA